MRGESVKSGSQMTKKELEKRRKLNNERILRSLGKLPKKVEKQPMGVLLDISEVGLEKRRDRIYERSEKIKKLLEELKVLSQRERM